MITNPRFAVLYVDDQQRALEFWTEKVGCTVVTDAPYGENDRWIEVAFP
ncbi:MAG: glyoxalase, partial [Micromonosporaceae bacterium]|nr:glyoxalase [Micromonosporaceae bacterium]